MDWCKEAETSDIVTWKSLRHCRFYSAPNGLIGRRCKKPVASAADVHSVWSASSAGKGYRLPGLRFSGGATASLRMPMASPVHCALYTIRFHQAIGDQWQVAPPALPEGGSKIMSNGGRLGCAGNLPRPADLVRISTCRLSAGRSSAGYGPGVAAPRTTGPARRPANRSRQSLPARWKFSQLNRFAGSGRAGAHAAGIRKAELTAAPVPGNTQLALSAGLGGNRGGFALGWSALGHGAAPVGETVIGTADMLPEKPPAGDNRSPHH